jgi:hypothetical protein
MAIASLKKMGIIISNDTLKKYKIRQHEVDLQLATEEDQVLIDIANEILLNRLAMVSNMGGGFENVRLVKCTGVVINPYNGNKEVRYDTDDSWINGVYYNEKQILKMYKEYKETKKLPDL